MSRLTKREEEILNYLKQEPMISQDELAARLRISRSAAAVHISNLIRKGYILGRGYIFNERSGVLVVGKAWLEVTARRGEGPASGKVEVGYGGVGYHLAAALARFRAESTLLTVVGCDETGEQLTAHLLQQGVKVDHVVRSPCHATAKEVVLEDGAGSSFRVAESDAFSSLNEELFAEKEAAFRSCRVILVDGTLPPREVGSVLARATRHNIPCSVVGAPLRELWENQLLSFPSLFLVCLEDEVRSLCGVTGEGAAALLPCCREILGAGLMALIIILGDQGIILSTREETSYFPIPPLQAPKSPLALTAAVAGGLAANYNLRHAVRRAVGMEALEGARREEGCRRA